MKVILKSIKNIWQRISTSDPLFADRLETALRVRQSRAGFWGKLGNCWKSLRKESAWHYRFPLLRLRYFVFDGERNYEIDFLRFLAVQLLDFSGFVCHLCLFLCWFDMGI